MKKLNFLRLALITLVGAGLLFSCKSTPDLEPVNAFDLLDSDAALYLSVPVQANSEFVTEAVKKLAGASEKDAQKIVERLDMAYLAIGLNGEIQLSVTGKIPQSFLGMALNEKKGWKSSALDGHVIYTHQSSLYQLSLPSASNAFLSHNIEPMVKRYNRLSYLGRAEEVVTEESSEVSNESLASDVLGNGVYQFLQGDGAQGASITMYSPLPQSFLKSFLGATDVKTPVKNVSAVLSPYRDGNSLFAVKLTLNLSDARTVKATCALLKVALFGIAAKIAQTGETQITITDLPISRARILSLIR